MASSITPERFAQGMTFDQYVAYLGSPQNLAREPHVGTRADLSAALQGAFEKRRPSANQLEAFKWLVAQPNGPAKMLVISEEWSSDCRRDVPTFGRIAAETGMELRIFTRDGEKFSNAAASDPAQSPNADLVNQFLFHKDSETFQSIPICVFYDRDFNYLYHYTEYPAIYDKERLVVQHMRGTRPGETDDQRAERSGREFTELQNSAFFGMWAAAAVDEIISGLHRKVLLGEV